MKLLSVEEKVRRHLDYWSGKPQKRPLTMVRLGGFFLNGQFAANVPLLEKGHVLTPDQIHVEDYLADYERMYNEIEAVAVDEIFTASPCTSFPWMEGIMGTQIFGADTCFYSQPIMNEAEELDSITFTKEGNSWYEKYIEFSLKLTEFAQGRFPVSQPILRGVTDTAGAIVGQAEMAIGLITEPDIMRKAFDKIVAVQRELVADQYAVTESYRGGRSFGFYHIWTPGTAIWFQEDLTAITAPRHFNEYFYKTSCDYVEGYDYSLVHLHPTSFFDLDGMLRVDGLKAVQLNKDVNGLTVREMVPECLKILNSGKCLVLGMGKLDADDIDAIYDCLPRERVAINAVVEDAREAEELLEYMEGKK